MVLIQKLEPCAHLSMIRQDQAAVAVSLPECHLIGGARVFMQPRFCKWNGIPQQKQDYSTCCHMT